MTFRNVYQAPLDATVVENKDEEAGRQLLLKEMNAAAAAQAAEPGAAPEPAAATPAEGGAEKRPMLPGMFLEGLKAGAASVVQGIQRVGEGLSRLPTEPAQGARQVLVEGLMPVLFSPLTAVFTSVGQSVENLAPEVANAELFDAEAGFTVRHLMAGAPAIVSMPPEQVKAMRQPMTVREAVETLGPLVAPGLPQMGRVLKAGVAEVKAAGAQRGSIGPPPEPSMFDRGAVGPEPPPGAGSVARTPSGGSVPQLAAVFPVTSGVLRLEFHRGVPMTVEAVKSIFPDLHVGVSKITGGFRGDLQRFRVDFFDENGRISSRVANEARDRLGGYLSRPAMGEGPPSPQQPTAPPELATPPRELGPGDAAPPTGPPTPPEGSVARINLERIAAPESVKQTISDLNKFAGEFLKEHRQRKPHAETIAEAEAGRWSLEQMLSHDPETILVDEAKALRLRDTAAAAAEFYDTLGKRALGGDAAAMAQLNDAFAVAVKLSALDEAQGRNLGRGLEMRKEMAVSQRAAGRMAPDKILEVSRKLGESEVDPLLAYRRVAALSEAQKRSFFRQVYEGLRAGRDLMHAAWIQALLSNPKTHAANMGGTGLIVYGDIAETYAAGWVNKILTRDPEGVQRVEAGIKLRAWAEAHQAGIRLMVKAWETGEEPFAIGKTTEHPRIAAETYGFSPESWFGQTIDVMGHTLRAKGMPTRGLIAEDAFWKGVAYDMEIKALAVREALSRGKEGPALAKEVGDLEAHPTADMVQRAQDHAVLLTLNRELGTVGRGLMGAANAIPGGRVLFPFMRTPGNSFKWVGQRLPFLSWVSYQNWSDLMAGGALRDRAIARTALGNAAAVAIAVEVMNGTITGGGPANKNLAALQRDPKTSTKPPYSICPSWTEECYTYSRLDPVGAYMGAIADYVELTSRIPENQEALDEWGAWGFAIVSATGQVAVSKNWMTGLRNVLDAQRDPGSGGAKLLSNFSKSIIPAGVREVAREVDDNTLREVRSIREALISGIPGLASTVPAARNPVTGETIQYAPGWGPDIVSPIFVTKINTHPVWKEIQENEANFPPVPDHIGRPPAEGPQMQAGAPPTGVKLTAEQKDRLVTLQTEVVKNGAGRTLFQELEHLVASKKYQDQSKGKYGGRQLMLETTYTSYRDKAIARLEGERFGPGPTLGEQIKTQRREAIKPLLPRTNPKSPQYQGPDLHGMTQELVDKLRDLPTTLNR
jgi:hypothetical protein